MTVGDKYRRLMLFCVGVLVVVFESNVAYLRHVSLLSSERIGDFDWLVSDCSHSTVSCLSQLLAYIPEKAFLSNVRETIDLVAKCVRDRQLNSN